MVMLMQEKNQKILLPFAAFKNGEKEKFDDKVENACIFCLAELNRDKGGGLLKKKPSEKIGFIAKAYYPFWIMSFREYALLFDGLNLCSYPIKNPAIPDLKYFKDTMSALSTRQAYAAFLSNQVNCFQNYDCKRTKVVDGLISDSEFIRELLTYTKESKITETPVVDGVLVSPSCDESQIKNIAKALSDTYDEIMTEIHELNAIIKLLNTKTQGFIKEMRNEVQGVEHKFSGQIKAAQAAFEEKKLKINKVYAETVTDVTKSFEAETLAIQKDIVKLEKTKNELNSKIEKIEKEIRNATINKDATSEEKWKEKKNELKVQLSRNSQLIENLEVKIPPIEENKKEKLFQLRQENESKLKDATKNLLDIESTRDAEKRIIQNEMENIEDLASKITVDIDKLSKILETDLVSFDTLGIRRENAPPSLVYMPFYLIYYMLDNNRRFSFVSPSIVSNRDISSRLKGIGKKKITQILQPRSQKIISVLNKFMVLLNENVAFSHEITQACSKVALLRSTGTIEELKKGLEDLKNEGWLSESELESFKQALS